MKKKTDRITLVVRRSRTDPSGENLFEEVELEKALDQEGAELVRELVRWVSGDYYSEVDY